MQKIPNRRGTAPSGHDMPCPGQGKQKIKMFTEAHPKPSLVIQSLALSQRSRVPPSRHQLEQSVCPVIGIFKGSRDSINRSSGVGKIRREHQVALFSLSSPFNFLFEDLYLVEHLPFELSRAGIAEAGPERGRRDEITVRVYPPRSSRPLNPP